MTLVQRSGQADPALTAHTIPSLACPALLPFFTCKAVGLYKGAGDCLKVIKYPIGHGSSCGQQIKQSMDASVITANAVQGS